MILNRQRKLHLPRRALEGFLREVQQRLGIADRELTVAFVSDRGIRELNRRFRGKAQPTDVLSFPAGAEQNGYLGDIAISAETARRQARLARRRFQQELQMLILHGVLHLMGFDHETDRGQMSRLERKLRRSLRLG